MQDAKKIVAMVLVLPPLLVVAIVALLYFISS